MANTLKFGNGEWYGKKDTILAYNDENSNYKPLPFNFSRASKATVVNKDGLIETVGSDMPRIDYKDDSNGALLLEPTRTNLIPYSEAFDNAYWGKSGVSETSGFISPDGTSNAFKLIEDTSNSLHYTYSSAVSVSAVNNNFSVFVKSAGKTKLAMRESNGTGRYASFDLTNKSVIEQNGTDAKIEELINGWFRISFNDVTTTSTIMGLFLLDDSYTSGSVITTYQGDGTSGVYIYGAQLEEGSYATSYIPTQGSAVTRLKDTCTQTPPTGVLGQTEGTLFFDVNISHIVGNEALGGINSGGYANHVTIQRIGNTIQFVRNSATQSGATIVTSSAITVGRYRLALAYKSGDIACFLNGTQVSTTQTQTFTNGTINLVRISGDAIGALPFADTYNKSQLYNTRLSNSELATLTQV